MAKYNEACESDLFLTPVDDEAVASDEEDHHEVLQGQDGAGAECLNFMKQVQEEQHMLANEQVQDANETEEYNESVMAECDLKSAPDREQLVHLLLKPAAMEPFRTEASHSPKDRQKADHLPSTLREALAMKDAGDVWNHLFRLNVRLRSARGGIDTGFLKNARNCRRAASNLNWHQSPSCK